MVVFQHMYVGTTRADHKHIVMYNHRIYNIMMFNHALGIYYLLPILHLADQNEERVRVGLG